MEGAMNIHFGWRDILILYGVPELVLIILGLGFASMMTIIARMRNWDKKRTFWISFIGFALLPVILFYSARLSSDWLGVNVAENILIYSIVVMFFVGLFSPFVYLVLRLRYRNLFQETPASLGNAPSDVLNTVQDQRKPKTKIIPDDAKIHNQAESISASLARQTSTEYCSSHIFVSYRRTDSADITGRIYDRLIGRFGREPIFKDVDSIPLGLDFKEYLEKKVAECDVLLAIIGDSWLDTQDASGKRRLYDPSDYVRIEIQTALERSIPVIPLLVRDAHMPAEKDLPCSLQKLVYRHGTPIRSDPDFHRDMDRLIVALERYMN